MKLGPWLSGAMHFITRQQKQLKFKSDFWCLCSKLPRVYTLNTAGKKLKLLAKSLRYRSQPTVWTHDSLRHKYLESNLNFNCSCSLVMRCIAPLTKVIVSWVQNLLSSADDTYFRKTFVLYLLLNTSYSRTLPEDPSQNEIGHCELNLPLTFSNTQKMLLHKFIKYR